MSQDKVVKTFFTDPENTWMKAWVENFFIYWNNGIEANNNPSLEALYGQLLNPTLQEKYRVEVQDEYMRNEGTMAHLLEHYTRAGHPPRALVVHVGADVRDLPAHEGGAVQLHAERDRPIAASETAAERRAQLHPALDEHWILFRYKRTVRTC